MNMGEWLLADNQEELSEEAEDFCGLESELIT